MVETHFASDVAGEVNDDRVVSIGSRYTDDLVRRLSVHIRSHSTIPSYGRLSEARPAVRWLRPSGRSSTAVATGVSVALGRRPAHRDRAWAIDLDLQREAGRDVARMLGAAAHVMAIWRRGKPDAQLHPSDPGGNYAGEQYQKLMADNGVACSMSRSGDVRNTAAMESFFSPLKAERIRGKVYRTRYKVRADVFDDTERFHDAVLRHSTIGYVSPGGFERWVRSA